MWEVTIICIWSTVHNATAATSGNRKTRECWPSFLTVIKHFLKGAVLNYDISRLGLCWLFCFAGSLFPPYLVCVALYVFFICTSLYVWPHELLDILTFNTFWVNRVSHHPLAINLLRFTPEPQTLLLIPPNQYVIHFGKDIRANIKCYWILTSRWFLNTYLTKNSCQQLC